MIHPFSSKATTAALFAATAVVSLNAAATTWAYSLPRVAFMLIAGGSFLIAISLIGFPPADLDRDASGGLKRLQKFALILGILIGGGNVVLGLWKLSYCSGYSSLECSSTDAQLGTTGIKAP